MSRDGTPRFDESILESLSNAAGVSGGEEPIRALLADAVRERVDSLEVDPMGSLVAKVAPRRKGRAAGQKKE